MDDYINYNGKIFDTYSRVQGERLPFQNYISIIPFKEKLCNLTRKEISHNTRSYLISAHLLSIDFWYIAQTS